MARWRPSAALASAVSYVHGTSLFVGRNPYVDGHTPCKHVAFNNCLGSFAAISCCCSISDDVGVNLTKLVLLSPQHVPAFAPRLGNNKGMLPVRLKLSGKSGLPGAAAIQVSVLVVVVLVMDPHMQAAAQQLAVEMAEMHGSMVRCRNHTFVGVLQALLSATIPASYTC